jgi:two-component system, NarL family, response regulator LiaR
MSDGDPRIGDPARTRDPIRILIVDDHPVVRRGIAFSLTAFDDLSVAGEASNGEDALRLCGELGPDVVLMDMMMPGMDGIAATRAMRRMYPQVKVLMLTSFQSGEMVRSALEAGAIGYLLKDMSIDELAQAVRASRSGQATLAKAATQALLQEPAPPPAFIEELTPRQREVLALVVSGLSNQEIADKLVVSLATVRFHVSTILAKLNAANRAEAAALAVKYNLLH